MARPVCRSPLMRHLLICVCFTIITTDPVSAAKPPKVDRLYPAGGQAGTEVSVTIGGSLGEGEVQLWSDAGQLTCRVAEDRKSVTLSIPQEARRGVHWLRFFNEAGTSVVRPFVVGQIPEISEEEPNNVPDEAGQAEPAAVTINGVLQKSGDVDIYRIEVPAGKTLVASMQANQALGSPMDSVLQLLDAQGTVVAQNDDDHQIDPQIVYQVPADGVYYVRAFAFPSAPNSTIKLAGAASYIYRLTLTHDAFIDHVIPAVVDRRTDSAVRLCGWNLPDEQQTAGLAVFQDHQTLVGRNCVLMHPVNGVSHPSYVESETSRTLSARSSVTGRIAERGERDQYVLPGTKGQKLRFRIAAREFNSLLDPVLTITAADGKVLSEADDRSRTDLDGETTVTVPADGPLTVTVSDRYGDGGFRYFYVLTCETPEPTFTATVGAAEYLLNQDEPLDVPVTVARKDGFAEKLTVSIEGLPEGVTAEPVVSEPEGDSSKKVTLKLTRGESAAASSGVIRVLCTADGAAAPQAAVISPGNTKDTLSDIWLTVIPKPKPAPEEPKEEPAAEEEKPAE